MGNKLNKVNKNLSDKGSDFALIGGMVIDKNVVGVEFLYKPINLLTYISYN